MPKLLIVAATPFEIEPLARRFNVAAGEALPANDDAVISILITGVGMVNTAYALGRCADRGFDYVINAGICGAFDRSLGTGEVVHVVSDILSEMGAENDNSFIRYTEMDLGGTNAYRHTVQQLPASFTRLKQVTGITVNKVHGNTASIESTLAAFNAQVESMEGAAFFRGCAHFSGSCLQVRAISNYVEKRDKSKWNIPLAIANLNDFLIQFITELNT